MAQVRSLAMVCRSAIPGFALLALLAGAVTAAAAEIAAAPSVSGDPSVGTLLLASSGAWTPADAAPAYAWLRCGSSGGGCTPIDGACGRRYRVAEDDLGHRLRIRLTVADAGGPPASSTSSATRVITRRPYTLPGEPEPANCATVTPSGPQAGSFESGTQLEPAVPSPVGTTTTPFITPFPVVRVAGRFTRGRTTITRVSVRAPRGVRIGLRCRGGGCGFGRRAIAVRLVRVPALQRRYRPGAVAEIRVTQDGHIGKYVRLRIRRGRAPVRIDRCLAPGSPAPVRCPAI
jgi:hypothetical protein